MRGMRRTRGKLAETKRGKYPEGRKGLPVYRIPLLRSCARKMDSQITPDVPEIRINATSASGIRLRRSRRPAEKHSGRRVAEVHSGIIIPVHRARYFPRGITRVVRRMPGPALDRNTLGCDNNRRSSGKRNGTARC